MMTATASKKDNITTPLVLRSTHLVLHLASVSLILIGIIRMPNPTPKGKLLEATHNRATIWLIFDSFYFILSCIMLISPVVNLGIRSLSPCLNRIKVWSRENCPNFSFFYYVLVSMFVLYGAMIGCHIPLLFSKKPEETWKLVLIVAVVCDIVNSVLYFVAAFFPLRIETAIAPAKEEQLNTEIEASNPVAEDEANNLQGEQEIKADEDKTAPDETEAKSETG